MSWLFLIASLVSLLNSLNAVRPRYRPAAVAAVSFFAGWLTAELALHHLVLQAIVAAGFIAEGALAHWPGALALLVLCISWGLLVWLHWRADAAHAVLE